MLELSLAVRRVGVGVGEASERLLVHGAQDVRFYCGEAGSLAGERFVEVLSVHRVSL